MVLEMNDLILYEKLGLIKMRMQDHTTQTPYGHFMEVENPTGEDNDNEARLISISSDNESNSTCLSFYYLMTDANGVNGLSIVLVWPANSIVLWSNQIDTGKKVI